MNDRCYELCSGIHSKLVSAGWHHIYNGDNSYRVYEQTIEVEYEYDIRAYVQDSFHGICDGGDIGIAWLEIRDTNDLNDGFLSPCDFRFMNNALATVEENLVKLGIPFSGDYDFNKHGQDPDFLKGSNLKLRDVLHVDEIVDEFFKECADNGKA